MRLKGGFSENYGTESFYARHRVYETATADVLLMQGWPLKITLIKLGTAIFS